MPLRRRDFLRLSALAAAAPGPALAAAAPAPEGILVEAERFADKGGWSVDAQFTHAMGAPFLLAHGMGAPVADAVTQIRIPEPGEWHVWARTRDWAREWTAAAPGRFRLLVNGAPLPAILGTASGAWGWQKAGALRLPAGPATLTLRDLTGLDARCDALYLSRDPASAFPDACCCASWTIDLHEPDPENAKRFPMPFKSVAHHSRFGGPWPIPYRCLYSRNVPNLFMAGRCVSVTHVALGTVRVMRTGGMMGEVVGMAAALCHRHGLDPRGVYERRLGDLKALMAQGFGDGAAHPPQNYNLGSG